MQPGDVISHYEIVDQLGGGGMGVVYKARDTKLDRLVALKFLPPEWIKDAEADARFVQEAKAASALDHPNICTIHDIRETEDGRLFIVMAYYEGQTLKYRLANGPMSVDEATDIVRQIADGLGAAHEAGIVHRDIKPANIMVTDKGRVKILDFGIAKLLGTTDLTQTGSSVGTPHYMSPEQIRGEPVDHRTDLWSLGVVLYQMVTGNRPFDGDYEQAVSYAIFNQEPEDLPANVPDALSKVCRGLLAKDPTERIQNAPAILTELGVSPDQSELSAFPLARPRWSKKQKMAFSVASLAAVTSLFLVGIARFSPSKDKDIPSTPSALFDKTIAVMPFAVGGGDELAYLEESMVDLLSLGLQGAGDLHTIDPNTILGQLGPDRTVVRDRIRAREVASQLGAGRFVLGGVTKLGPQIRINASLYNDQGQLLQQAEARAPSEDRLAAMVDTLVVQLVAGQVAGPLKDFVPMASKSTSSFQALKAYLRGEYAYRQGRFDEGERAFKEAFTLDTTFALAIFRAGDWNGQTREAHEWLVHHPERLPERERMLFEVLQPPTGSYTENIRRFQEVTARYPNFARGWFRLGDYVYHRAYRNGMFTSDARPYLERALRLDPNNAEVLFHLIDLAKQTRDFGRVDSLVELYPDQTRTIGSRILSAVWRNEDDTVDSLLTTFNETLVGFNMADVFDAIKLLQEVPFVLDMLDFASEKGMPKADRALVEGLVEAARGRFRASDSLMIKFSNLRSHGLFAAAVTTICFECPAHEDYLNELRDRILRMDTVRVAGGQHVDEYPEIQAYLAALVAFRLNDESTFEQARRTLLSIVARKGAESLARSLAETLEALVQWRSGNVGEAIQAIERADPGSKEYGGGFMSPFNGHALDRYLRAEFLYADGRYEEALPWFSSLVEGGMALYWSIPYEGPSLLRRAEIYEYLGETDKAIDFYRRFIKLWADADAEVQPLVDEARKALDDLMEGGVREPER